ncbi:hypothetical protein [Clostridium sp.]|uniref:hypothetical protein n=1 Tax=Clostridium sp. TaxID=1506 RepID=UPI003D6CF5C2
MQTGWNFPSNNYGQLTGIGEAGIETFKGAPYSSLAREICQNSLDARLDVNKPVIVEFSKFYIDSEEVPGSDELKDALSRCNDFWERQGNKKTANFFKKALDVASSNKIAVLRISDFNTTGLTGSDKEYNTPWQNLVKSSGVSDKGGSAGGSFGIGKSAPFACSEVRTIFYSTLDKDYLNAAQGVARLVSFKDITNDTTQGIGYYGEMQRNKSLTSQLGLDNRFERHGKTGTDVYILGFIENEEWEKEMIKSVLDGFLISIFQEKLVVKIEKNGISKETLPFFIDKYKNEAKLAYNYYQVLTSENSEKIVTSFEDLGGIELYVLMQPNLHRKVLVSRSSGMKIFDKQNISSTIQFASILILKDDKINSYFREMETPQHNAWEADRHYEPKKAKKARAQLFKYIKETILSLGRSNVSDEIDAEGVGEYLPDELNFEQREGQTDKDESITDKTKDIELKVVDRVTIFKGSAETKGKHVEEDDDITGDNDDGSDNDNGDSDNDTGNKRNGGQHNKTSANGNEDGENNIKKEVELRTSYVRTFVIDDLHNKYKLTIMPERSSLLGYVKVKLSGEQSSVMAKVKNAYLNDDKMKSLKCCDGKIFVKNISQKQKMTLSFILDYTENCSMEVSLYGYSK